jgi:hypothetical protein
MLDFTLTQDNSNGETLVFTDVSTDIDYSEVVAVRFQFGNNLEVANELSTGDLSQYRKYIKTVGSPSVYDNKTQSVGSIYIPFINVAINSGDTWEYLGIYSPEVGYYEDPSTTAQLQDTDGNDIGGLIPITIYTNNDITAPNSTVLLNGGAFISPRSNQTVNITLNDTAYNTVTPVSVTGSDVVLNIIRNTVAPVISGTAVVGSVLSCTTGTWIGSGLSYTYQWFSNGVAIGGATSSTFTLTQTQAGNSANISCVVTATNGIGYSVSSNIIVQVLDLDWSNFLTATGITDATTINAWNTAVISLKSSEVWAQCLAIYPFLGGTSSTCKFNLKDAQDTDSAYRILFSGSWTFDSLGATGNGTNTFADTRINPSTKLTGINSGHLSLFITKSLNTNNTAREIGGQQGIATAMWASLSNGSAAGYFAYRENAAEGATGGNASIGVATGMWIGSRISSTQIYVLNRRLLVIGGTTASSGSRPNLNMYIGAHNVSGTAGNFGTKTYGLASIGEGLSINQMNAYDAIITQAMIETGRI